VADLRRRDMAAGGQGAPLVPAYHRTLFQHPEETRVVLNIGGIANITLLPAGDPEGVRGFDTGPGNCLMDYWIRNRRGLDFDAGGDWAGSGRVDAGLLEALRADAYFQRPMPKSTGTEYFSPAWLEQRLAGRSDLPRDVQATLVELTATTIADAVLAQAPDAGRLLVCGGGVHNTRLLERLSAALPGIPVEDTGRYGADPDWIEAAAFAWLARETLAGRPGNLPAVTGARRPVLLGAIHPA